MNKQTVTISVIVIILLLLLLLYKKQENLTEGESITNLSNEAIQNIASVYADQTKTAYFNNLSVTNSLQTNSLQTNSLQTNGNVDISGNINVTGNIINNETIQTPQVNTHILSNNDGTGQGLIDVKSTLHFNGTGLRRWTIPMATKMAAGGTGILLITDPSGSTYSADKWVIWIAGINAQGAFMTVPYVGTDNKWYMAYAFPMPPTWPNSSVDVLAIPISIFELVWNNTTNGITYNPGIGDSIVWAFQTTGRG